MTRNEYAKLYRSCLKKVPHETVEHARETLRAVIVKGLRPRRHPEELHTYRCPACGKWHLGNTSKGVLRHRAIAVYREIAAGQSDWWPVHEAYLTMDLKTRRRVAADGAKKSFSDLSDNRLNDQSSRLPANHRLHAGPRGEVPGVQSSVQSRRPRPSQHLQPDGETLEPREKS